MKAKKKAAARTNVIELRLPKDTHQKLESFAKLAGVPVGNVVKIAMAERVMQHRAQVAQGAPHPPAQAASAAPRYITLGADGKPTKAIHVAVHDRQTGLTWTAAPLADGKAMNHADAMKACADLRLMGHSDWRAPTGRELLGIIEYERHDPAVDPSFFQGPFGWTWTSTPYKGNSGAAWGVLLDLGDSGWLNRGNRFRVRAVRASQPIGLTE